MTLTLVLARASTRAIGWLRSPSRLIVFVRLTALLIAALLAPATVRAQHGDHADDQQPPPHQHDGSVTASELFPSREASGTAWLPDATPMYAIHRTLGQWEMMLHGTAFGQFLYEPGERHRTGGVGRRQMSSVNWGMLMARRPLGAGRFGLRAMVSGEPWTVSDCGFLNLLATGEMCQGDTIHDRQHPHDLFMELAADYDRPLAGSLRWQLYAGLSGEPALGLVGFPHRVSAMPNPVAPISHHWLDSSHIAFGVITAGLYRRQWKAEMSVFNGREPDQNRADLDLAALDSVSRRLSVLFGDQVAFQVSSGHLEEAEAEFAPFPRSDINRTTASLTYHRPFGDDSLWATTIGYGVNSGPEIVAGQAFEMTTHAALVESALTIGERQTWFGRAEVVGKPAHDLHAHEFTTRIFTVGKLEAGYVRYFKPWNQWMPGLGAMASASLLPRDLAPRYFGRVAPGMAVFLTIRPTRHAM